MRLVKTAFCKGCCFLILLLLTGEPHTKTSDFLKTSRIFVDDEDAVRMRYSSL